MNSKLIVLIILSTLLSSCGVKAPPLKHPDTIVESYVRQYTVETDPQVNKEQTEPATPAPKN